MSCNIRIPLQQIIDDVAAALSDGFIKTDNAVLTEAVLNEVTIRGDISVDTAARNALCAILQTCGITAIELEWLDRPTVADMVAVSEVVDGEVVVSWKDLDTLITEGIAGKVQTTDVVDSSGVSQEEINTDIRNELDQKTTRTFNKIADLVADAKLKNGQYVNTLSYNTTGDGGGAFYLVSNTATDYSIPLANGLHAVFSDSFDIRKFGIRDSATLNQSTELLRMRNYADTREYVIDFHGFSIMTPDLNAGITGSMQNIGAANGLWFEQAHHYKNLTMYSDKVNRLNTGKCQLIFCPTVDPETEQLVIYENIILDPWSDNYQPFTENYSQAYDGMRHGIFIHPKGSWDGLFNTGQKDYSTNFSFKFINIKFLSSAYSYNITQAGFRCRNVTVDGLTGDCIVGLNLDCVNLDAKGVHKNVRYDLAEPNRPMVFDAIHYEPEHGSAVKDGLLFEYTIKLDDCHVTSVTREGVKRASGQLLWVATLGSSKLHKLEASNCNGIVELQASNRGLNIGDVLFKDCTDGIFLLVNSGAVAKNILFYNCVVQRLVKSNTQYTNLVNNLATVDKWEFKYCTFKALFVYDEPLTPFVGINQLIFDNMTIDEAFKGFFATNLFAKELVIRNSDFSNLVDLSFFRYMYDLEKFTLDNVKFKNLSYQSILSVRYSTTDKSTAAKLSNISIMGGMIDAKISIAGTVDIINMDSDYLMPIGLPVDVAATGEYTYGTNVVVTNLFNVKADLHLNKSYTLTDSVAANSSVKKTYAVNKDCKDIALTFSVDLPTGISVSKYRYADTYVVVFTNDTAEPVALGSITMTVKQII